MVHTNHPMSWWGGCTRGPPSLLPPTFIRIFHKIRFHEVFYPYLKKSLTNPTMHEDAFGQHSEVANNVTRLTQNTFYTRKNVILPVSRAMPSFYFL